MGKSPRKRLDTVLLERGLAPSRSAAVGYILAGHVYSGARRLDKPGTAIAEDTALEVRSPQPFVSRGGIKLDRALADVSAAVAGRVWVDIGASTGGFTDCLLQRGATKVYAVDVGRGQLADKLRRDGRVVNLEGVNARHLTRQAFAEPVDAVVVDASFIGLGKLLPAIARVLPRGGELLAMIKPQFEAGKELASKHRGVIRDEGLRRQIVERVMEEVRQAGFTCTADAPSRLPGPKGNVEHFVLAELTSPPAARELPTPPCASLDGEG